MKKLFVIIMILLISATSVNAKATVADKEAIVYYPGNEIFINGQAWLSPASHGCSRGVVTVLTKRYNENKKVYEHVSYEARVAWGKMHVVNRYVFVPLKGIKDKVYVEVKE